MMANPSGNGESVHRKRVLNFNRPLPQLSKATQIFSNRCSFLVFMTICLLDQCGIPVLLHFYRVKRTLENIRRANGNTTYCHLRAYFSRLLLLGLVMVIVSAVNDAPQQAVKDPAGNKKRWVIGGMVTGAVLLLVILNILVCYLCSRTRRLRKSCKLNSSWQYEGGPTYTEFSHNEILDATNKFDEALVIGEGAYGKVYRGSLTVDNEKTSVAIKRASGLYNQGEKEFRAEIKMLSNLRHHHLISLIGHCAEKSEMILVYEYMDQGTLRKLLYDIDNPPTQPLTWIQRLNIAIDSAIGLHYLHTGAQRPIIHRDVKSSNILIDSNFVTKVSDFGLSKELPPVDTTTELSHVKGSYGYLDPEYVRSQRFTEKSDVYSFGVLLFEILCARLPRDLTLPEEQLLLSEWALHCYQNNILDQIIDPHLQEEILPQCLEIYVATAVKCLAAKGKDRPTMGGVLVSLHALDLQLSDYVFLQMPSDGIEFLQMPSDGITTRKSLFRDDKCRLRKY